MPDARVHFSLCKGVEKREMHSNQISDNQASKKDKPHFDLPCDCLISYYNRHLAYFALIPKGMENNSDYSQVK